MSIQQWQQFLAAFPTSAKTDIHEKDTILCDLSHLGLLEISGEDAVTFLQGQVTNDVKLLDGSKAHYSGYCNPKGRLLALFLAFAHRDHLHLQLPQSLLEPIAKRLKMFVLRSKVNIQDVSDNIIRFGISGSNATSLLQSSFGTLPQQPYELVTFDDAAIIRLPGAEPRYQVFTDIEHARAIWQQLAENSKTVAADYWEWLEICAGIPQIYPSTQEEFVPQMVNLDLLNGINFKKGCYTGQEIVARTHYLGTVKRRTYLAHLDGQNAPDVGTDVMNANQEIVGKIVRSTSAPEGGIDVLAELRTESAEAGNLIVNGQALTLQRLPYSL